MAYIYDLQDLHRLINVGNLYHGDGAVALQEAIGEYFNNLHGEAANALVIFDDYIRDIDDPNINNVMLDYVRERIQYEIPYYQGGSKKKTVKKSKKIKKVKKKRVKRVKRLKRGGNRFLKSKRKHRKNKTKRKLKKL